VHRFELQLRRIRIRRPRRDDQRVRLDFGDDATGIGATPAHTYTAAGSYTVGLTLTDNRGQTALITHDVNVTPPPVITYASDQFARTGTTGFGTAPVGGIWTNTGAVGNLSVSAGTGNIRLDAGRKQSVYLASANAPQADMLLRFGLDKPPTGGGVQVAAYGRRVAGQGGYGGKAKLGSSGSVSVEIVPAEQCRNGDRDPDRCVVGTHLCSGRLAQLAGAGVEHRPGGDHPDPRLEGRHARAVDLAAQRYRLDGWAARAGLDRDSDL
jgi:hypothetical protein